MSVPKQDAAGQDATVIVVGAGLAGSQAAATLRADGFSGRILLIGEEPRGPYERPPLSKAFLAGGVSAERLALRKPAFYAEKGIELRTGCAVERIDRAGRTVYMQDGTAERYDRLVLATGARVRRLAVPQGDLPGVLYLRSLDDAAALRDAIAPGTRLAVIGAGYIGLEVAASAAKLGAEVAVIETASRLMARTSTPDMAAVFEQVHRAHGVVFHFGAAVEAIVGQERVAGVRLADGKTVAADLVVVGIGVVPEDSLARACGLACDNGVLVDAEGRTSDPAIFAAGDVANQHNGFAGGRCRLESVPSAILQGTAVARAIAGRPLPPAEVPWFWSEQYDLKLQIAGISRPDDAVLLRGEPGGRGFSVLRLGSRGELTAAETVNAARDFMAARKLIAEGRPLDRAVAADATRPLADAMLSDAILSDAVLSDPVRSDTVASGPASQPALGAAS